jgi:hypothetical protein
VTPESGFTYGSAFLFYARDTLVGSNGGILEISRFRRRSPLPTTPCPPVPWARSAVVVGSLTPFGAEC